MYERHRDTLYEMHVEKKGAADENFIAFSNE
jgi:hypothetical protein